MYTSDFVRIYKDELMDWPMKISACWHLWIYLRMTVASKDECQAVGKTNSIEWVSFGQIVTSKQYLANQLHLTTRTIAKYLQLLADDGRIIVTDEKNFIRITIPNYERFCTPTVLGSPIQSALTSGSENKTPVAEEQSSALQDGHTTVHTTAHDTMHDTMHSTEPTSGVVAVQNQKILPGSSIVVVEEKKKENSNLISTTTSMREKEFFEQLRNSESDLDVIMKQMRLEKVEDVLEQLDVFEIHILGQDKLHKNYSDFIGHFTNWYPKYKAKKSAKSQAPKPNGTQAPRTWRDNSGIDTNARSYKDYLEPI